MRGIGGGAVAMIRAATFGLGGTMKWIPQGQRTALPASASRHRYRAEHLGHVNLSDV
jgi:hypothetical protein